MKETSLKNKYKSVRLTEEAYYHVKKKQIAISDKRIATMSETILNMK